MRTCRSPLLLLRLEVRRDGNLGHLSVGVFDQNAVEVDVFLPLAPINGLDIDASKLSLPQHVGEDASWQKSEILPVPLLPYKVKRLSLQELISPSGAPVVRVAVVDLGSRRWICSCTPPFGAVLESFFEVDDDLTLAVL